MTDILELIDNAIDGNTSADAMRWTPDPPRPMLPDPAVVQAAVAEIGRQMAERVKPVLEAFGAMARQLTPVFEQVSIHLKTLGPILREIESDRRARVTRMHAAYRRRH